MTRGGGDVVPVLPELAMRRATVHFEDEIVPVEQEYSPVTEDQPPVSEDQPPVIEDQPEVADQFGQEDRTVNTASGTRVRVPVQVPHPHNTRLQQRRSMADHSLTTSGVPDVKVKLSGSLHTWRRERERVLWTQVQTSVSSAEDQG
jgi:hypothetical protein